MSDPTLADPTAMTNIRPATLSDIAELVRWQLQLRDHHRSLEPSNPRYLVGEAEWAGVLRNALEHPETLILLAEDGERLMGFVQLSFVEKPWGKGCEMDTLVVDESQRGRRIGSQLVAAAERHAKDTGAKGIRANVVASNEQGRRFYEREGYELFAVRYGKSL